MKSAMNTTQKLRKRVLNVDGWPFFLFPFAFMCCDQKNVRSCCTTHHHQAPLLLPHSHCHTPFASNHKHYTHHNATNQNLRIYLPSALLLNVFLYLLLLTSIHFTILTSSPFHFKFTCNHFPTHIFFIILSTFRFINHFLKNYISFK